MQTVDEYIQANVQPEYVEAAEAVRALMRDAAPETRELMSYNMPCWVRRHIIAYLNANKQGLTFSFTYGVGFEDKYGLLRGDAKNARFVKLKRAGDVATHEEALRYYIRQALDQEPE
ncbi:MAG: DUF1801 domain-containing protein [Anaerolinea sp.]|nr:DUF1801 domain-containing protein [Anaerolinea sp.]